MKTLDETQRYIMSRMRPHDVKKEGRRLQLREDWEKVKDEIMHGIIYAKFTQDEELRTKLIATGDAYLMEGNTWCDTYWGIDNRLGGKNKLGQILMQVRRVEPINY